MLTLPIEAEIEKEHKIIRNLNKRQTICAGIVAVSALGLYAYLDDLTYSLLLTAPIMLICAYIGWKKTDGLNAEELAMKKIKQFFFKNSSRKYRTKNMYFALMNKGYRDMRNKDMADPKIAKKITKVEKSRQNRKNSSRVRKIM